MAVRELANRSLDEGSPSVEIQQSQYSTSTCRRKHTPTPSASSSNLETCTLIGDRYIARRRPGDTCLLEMGSSSRRLSLHRHQVDGATSVNTSLEKGLVNIEAPETGITYIPIWARRGPSTSSSPSSAAWRKARDANTEALETGLTFRPIQAKERGPALTQRQVSPIDRSGHESRRDFEVRPSAQRQASAISRSGSILENRHLPLGERLVRPVRSSAWPLCIQPEMGSSFACSQGSAG